MIDLDIVPFKDSEGNFIWITIEEVLEYIVLRPPTLIETNDRVEVILQLLEEENV